MTEATTGASASNQTTLKNKEHALVKFGLDPDRIIQKDGRYWMTAKEIGIALGYNNPAKGIRKLYERNRDELEPYKGYVKIEYPSAKDGRGGGSQKALVFNTDGMWLIALLSKASKAKKFRKFIVNMLKALERQEFIHISQVMQWKKELIELRIGKQLAASSIMDWKKYDKMARYKKMGLTQKEIAKLLDVSPRTINRFERTAGQFELKLVSGGAYAE